MRDRIGAELRLSRSPEAVWADLVAEGVEAPLCVESIYTAVYGGAVGVKATECLRTRRPRRRRRQTRHPNGRAGLPNIGARPAVVNDRTQGGHWEADQIIGAANRSSMCWLTERVTRFAIPTTMPLGYDVDDVESGA